MKLNTSLFICLFFSAIIAIKAENDVEYEEISSENTENDNVDQFEDEVDEEQYDASEVGNQEPEAVFQYNPSKRLEDMEKNLSNSDKAFVADGNVKQTMINTFDTAMSTDVALNGLAGIQHEWQLILEGPEASRVIGTIGQNFNKVFTSTEGGDMINILATTVHVLLTKAGEKKMVSGLSDILSMTYSLFTSTEMPVIVSKASGLIITAANKPKALMFVKQYWKEISKLLDVKNLNIKLNKYFTNIKSMMQSLSGMKQGGQQIRRKR